MDAKTSFTDRSNARRAAKRLIAAGDAPAQDFDVIEDADGRFTIAWQTASAPTTEEVETESESPTETAQEGDPMEAHPEITEVDVAADQTEGEPAPVSEEAELPADVLAEIEADVARYRETKISRAKAKQARQQRRPRAAAGTPRPRKANAVDEAAARGIMPEKPVIASPTNQHYQKRLDKLAELAGAGDWPAIAAYEVKGGNTYAKMVVQYRDRLLTAHAAAAQQQG